MPADDRSGPLAREAGAYALRLRRSAGVARTEAQDEELSAILDRVGRRRAGHASLGRTEVAPAPPTGGPSGAPGLVLAVHDVGPTMRILQIARPADFTFIAGQHLKAGISGTRRGTFSIASAPHDPHLELCVKLVPGGRLTPALFRVQPGDQLEVTWTAKGGFRLDDGARTHVMVATGTGITPLRSMVRGARHRGQAGAFIVLHGASHADELPYHDELAELARTEATVRYLPTVSRPREARSAGWAGATGRVDDHASAVASTLDPATTRVYVCGNAGMVEHVTTELGGRGLEVSSETFT